MISIPAANWLSCALNQIITLTHNLNITLENLPKFKILYSNVINPNLANNVIVDMTNQSSGTIGCSINLGSNNTIILRFGSVAVCQGVGSGNSYIQVTSGYFRVYIY